jgi:hypothetical protein
MLLELLYWLDQYRWLADAEYYGGILWSPIPGGSGGCRFCWKLQDHAMVDILDVCRSVDRWCASELVCISHTQSLE